MKVSVKALQAQTKRVLASIDRGEEVILTYRGQPRARLVAIEGAPAAAGTLELFGIWKHRGDVADVARHVDELRGHVDTNPPSGLIPSKAPPAHASGQAPDGAA